MAKKSDNPNASAWDKISGKSAGETLANRDVYEGQQLDRSAIQGREGKGSRIALAGIVGGIIFVLIWLGWSGAKMGIDTARTSMPISVSQPYYEQQSKGSSRYCYQILDAKGKAASGAPCYDTLEEAEANPPKWYKQALDKAQAERQAEKDALPQGFGGYVSELGIFKLLLSLLGGLSVFGVMYPVLMRNLDAQNMMHDTTDINQYAGDQHIALPEEVQRKFDWFPNVGAHSAVQVSSMISHVMIQNKGLKKIDVSRRAEGEILDADGDVEYIRGEIMYGDDGKILTTSESMIDEDFGEALFDASNLPSGKEGKVFRKRYDTTKIEYNPDGSNRDKLGKYKTVADLINADWEFPSYEVQRPSGAYIVDTAPVNTMVLAITRAGKGQTYIEPMIDMWLREKRPSNMVINDPKGELLVKNYVRATLRGYQVVQFNLINAMKTDIYNPLGMAAEAAREGDSTKCALYVENIADVFFPTDGGEDPVWPNAANNAFKRAAYGLIDYYLEEERELRNYAASVDMDPKLLETRLDEMWGRVTLYNCYQLFVQLTSKKLKSPTKLLEDRLKNGDFGDPQSDDDFDEVGYEEASLEAERRAFLWEGNPEMDMLTLFFNATEAMPRNTQRTLIGNANNALRAMAGAEKMLASVYGIAITAMSFFTDPTISTLTSGSPSQNTDLGGLSFPRRMGVRFSMAFLKREHIIGMQAKWDAFSDAGFTQALGKDFEHEDIVSREGWARYYFDGKFESNVAYLRLRLINPSTGMLIRTMYFRFTKDFQTNLSGRTFITDPITGEKIVKNGVIVELKPVKDGAGETRYEVGHTEYPKMMLTNLDSAQPDQEMGQARAIISTSVRYSERPKVVFLVTPPHLMKYAKLILILVKQLVDLNFDKSYMTKSNQKPLYKTRFMLDELGNLQSEGHGISGFETMLSIGLGQEQQFTLILQTLQQLRDVYGESVDKIVQGNAQPYSAKIATPAGWTTMGEIQEGDTILVPDGGTALVDGVFPRGTRPVFEVTRADGASTEACNEHLWEVEIEWPEGVEPIEIAEPAQTLSPDARRLLEGLGRLHGPGMQTPDMLRDVYGQSLKNLPEVIL